MSPPDATTVNQGRAALHRDVVIIGAGLAGMMAAHVLQAAGRSVVLLDKGYHPGGRISSKRVGPALADSGAQFFTVRSDEFRAHVDGWIEQGLVFEWSRGWSDGSLGTSLADGHPRYAVRGGMRQLALHLADGLDVRTRVRVVRVVRAREQWTAVDETGQRYSADALLLTSPVPQSLALLEAGDVTLSPTDRAVLSEIRYDPCLAGLFWLDGTLHLPEPGAVQRPHATITWIADNQRKGVSPDTTLITVHAGPDYSRQLWDASTDRTLHALQSALTLFKAGDADVVERTLKRWRYAQPVRIHNARWLAAEHAPTLVFAGDAFGGPRVEGATLSGLAAGAYLAG